jgi:molybdopterin converting factor small subunit
LTKVRINGPQVPAEMREVEIDADVEDVGGLITELIKTNPTYGKHLLTENGVRTDLNILINGRNCMFLDGLRSKVDINDVVDILLPVIGG